MKWIRVILVTLFALGGLIFVAAWRRASHTHDFAAKARHAQGTIVGNHIYYDGKGQRRFYPTFSFRSDDGREIVVTSGVGTSPPSFTLGQKVEVLYLPGLPEGAIISTPAQKWLGTILSAALGLVYMGIMAFVWVLLDVIQNPKKTIFLTKTLARFSRSAPR